MSNYVHEQHVIQSTTSQYALHIMIVLDYLVIQCNDLPVTFQGRRIMNISLNNADYKYNGWLPNLRFYEQYSLKSESREKLI